VTYARLAFYVFYIGLGGVILARMLAFGLRPQLIPGLVLGVLLIVLGVYRLSSFFQSRERRDG